MSDVASFSFVLMIAIEGFDSVFTTSSSYQNVGGDSIVVALFVVVVVVVDEAEVLWEVSFDG
jgi:hypothetical protein